MPILLIFFMFAIDVRCDGVVEGEKIGGRMGRKRIWMGRDVGGDAMD